MLMPLVNCLVCSKEFYIKPNRLDKGWGKYCSNTCKHSAQITGILTECYTCKKTTYKTLKNQSRSKSGKYFCSKSCQATWRNTLYTQEKHANWTGGESSYRDILRRSGIDILCLKCKSEDVRILAVHHKDKDRSNNAVSNLIWLCHNCHFLVHHYKNEAAGFLVPVA